MCFGTHRQVALRNVYLCEEFWRSLSKKWYLQFYLTQIVHSNGKILFHQPKNCYQSFYGASLSFSNFFFKEKICVSARVGKSLYEMFICVKSSEDPCRKNDISSSVWHKSFIQTVKYSFISQRIVYESFYGALLAFSYFFLQGKVFCCGTRRQVRRLRNANDVFWSLLKKIISPVLFDKSFIQTVKYSFFSQRLFYLSFYGALLTLSYFFFQRIVLCLGTRRQVACMLSTKCL